MSTTTTQTIVINKETADIIRDVLFDAKIKIKKKRDKSKKLEKIHELNDQVWEIENFLGKLH